MSFSDARRDFPATTRRPSSPHDHATRAPSRPHSLDRYGTLLANAPTLAFLGQSTSPTSRVPRQPHLGRRGAKTAMMACFPPPEALERTWPGRFLRTKTAEFGTTATYSVLTRSTCRRPITILPRGRSHDSRSADTASPASSCSTPSPFGAHQVLRHLRTLHADPFHELPAGWRGHPAPSPTHSQLGSICRPPLSHS